MARGPVPRARAVDWVSLGSETLYVYSFSLLSAPWNSAHSFALLQFSGVAMGSGRRDRRVGGVERE